MQACIVCDNKRHCPDSVICLQLTSGALSYPWTQDATAVTGFSKSVQGLSPPYMGRKLLSAIGYFHQPGQMELLTVIVPKVLKHFHALDM